MKYPKIYKPTPKDIGVLCKLDQLNTKELLSYALNNINRMRDSFSNCDNKATTTITFVISLNGAFYLLTKDNPIIQPVTIIIYITNLFMVLFSVSLSLWSLFARYHECPPSIGDTIKWVTQEDSKTLNERMIPTLIHSVSQAEINFSEILEKKINLLRLSQAIGFISITYIFISMMIIKIIFS